MCSPLHIRASNKVANFAIDNRAQFLQNRLVTTVLISNFVGVHCRACAAGNCTYDRAFFATDQTAEKRTTNRAPRSGDLVAMLIPDRTLAAIAISVVVDAGVVPVVIPGAIDRLIVTQTRAPLRSNWQSSHAENDQASKSCD